MKSNAVVNGTMDKKTNRKPVKYRMVRETIYFYPSQVERAETLCLKYGLSKSELMCLALEAYLRYFGLQDPELKYLTNDVVKEKAAEYRDEFMRPFVEAMEEQAG